MFLWRNKKNINTFWLKKASYLHLCKICNCESLGQKHAIIVSVSSKRIDIPFRPMLRVKSEGLDQLGHPCNLGPVVQSVVSLTSSLRVISLTVLADSIYNILIFFAEKM